MEKVIFKLEGPYIELIQLLKATSVAQTGGHAKMIVDEELVTRNGHPETRKRAKIIIGDLLEIKLDEKSTISILVE